MTFNLLNIFIGACFAGLGYLVLLKADVIQNQVAPFTFGPKDIHGVLGYKLTGIFLMLLSAFIVTGILNIGGQFENTNNQNNQQNSSSSSTKFPTGSYNGIIN